MEKRVTAVHRHACHNQRGRQHVGGAQQLPSGANGREQQVLDALLWKNNSCAQPAQRKLPAVFHLNACSKD